MVSSLRSPHHPRRGASFFAAVLLTLAAACKKDSPVAKPVPATITVNAVSQQLVGTVGQQVPETVSVHVADSKSAPVAGTVVTWAVVGGGGTVSSPTSTTDVNGNATVGWTLGTVAGLDSLSASVTTTITTMISATANAGAVATLQKVSGDGQSLPEGGQSAPLIVKALDQFGNAVAGASITWVDQSGGALTATTVTTDATGVAQVMLMTDAVPETYTIIAEVSDSVKVTFTESAP
jgi:hypothetical protein